MKKRCLVVLSLILGVMVLSANVCFAKLAPSRSDFPNKKLLVSAESVQATIGTKNFVVVDARTAGYETSHIPGAINIKFGEYFTPGTGLLPVADLNSKLSAAGLNKNMTIVIYDNTSASFGAAGRIFWMLEYLGCKKVHILDGGWDKWVADGRPTETTLNALPAAKFKGRAKKARKATKESIQKKLGTKKFAIVDSRTDEEYNGWQLYGEARGGHIPGAIQIPYAWFFNADKTVLNYNDLKTMFESRGITRKMEVTAYCTVGIRSGFVYFLYRLMGYNKASNYDGSIAEWAADSSLPMEKMANYEKLVHPAWVAELIKGGNPGTAGSPPTYPGKGYVIVHASSLYWKGAANPNGYNQNADYESGHIPGAISIPLHTFDTTVAGGIYPWTKPEDGMLLPPDQLKAVIESYGITHDKTVVVYNGDKSYIGGAYRVAWALMYAGVEDVRYMNGDLPAWTASGGELETITNIPTPVQDFGVTVPVHPEYYASVEQVEAMTSDPTAVIADDRNWTEYSAVDASGCYYEFFCVPGHVPNAVWVHDMFWYLDDMYTGNQPGYYKPASLRSYTEIAKEWSDLGITTDTKVAFYCGGGWRSSLVWFTAYLMGYKNATNFAGGYYEWTWDPNRPVEVGAD